MSSSYSGLYVQRSSDGGVFKVQVVDSDGNHLPLKPEIYVERGIKPPIDALPDEKDYRASQ